jgi:hypothetical protein
LRRGLHEETVELVHDIEDLTVYRAPHLALCEPAYETSEISSAADGQHVMDGRGA